MAQVVDSIYLYKVLSFPRSGRQFLATILQQYLNLGMPISEVILFTHNMKDEKDVLFFDDESLKDIPGAIIIRHPIPSIISYWEYACKYIGESNPYNNSKRILFLDFVKTNWDMWISTYTKERLENNHIIQYSSLLYDTKKTIDDLMVYWDLEASNNIDLVIENNKGYIKDSMKAEDEFKKRNVESCPFYSMIEPINQKYENWKLQTNQDLIIV